MGKLDGKVVIVTGASRGLGTTIARLFCEEGGRVVCAARTLHEGEHKLEGSLERTVAELRGLGGEAIAVACDISSEAECERLVQETRDAFGPCDVLVNNAVLTYFQRITDLPVNRWMRSFGVNVHGPLMLSKLVLPEMIERRSGAIVNISSSAAKGPGRGPYHVPSGQAGTALYGATKAALERLTQGLALEVYEYGISVACVSPSQAVTTPGTSFHQRARGVENQRPDREPPEYVARVALLLATEPLDKVTGLVTYSQAFLKEHGLIGDGRGWGVERPGSGYSQARPHLKRS